MTVYAYATIRIQIETDDNVDINEVLEDMDYNFKSQTKGAEVADTDWIDTELEDEV